MHTKYFEQLYRDDARRAEWRSLDLALATRTGSVYAKRSTWRTLLERWMFRTSARWVEQ